LVLAALLVTHTPSALLFLVVLGGHFIAWSTVQSRQGVGESGLNAPTPNAKSLILGAAAVVLGGLIASGYLLPAFLEQGAVWGERLRIGESFWRHFPTDGLGGLLSFDLIHRYGLGQVKPEVFQYQIGLAQWVFGLLGALVIAWRWSQLSRVVRVEGALAIVVIATATFMCLSASTPV
jgi:hypothetical protein